MIRQERPSDEHIADLIFQLSRLDWNGEFEPINTVYFEIAYALYEQEKRDPVRFRLIFERVARQVGFSAEKQQDLLDEI